MTHTQDRLFRISEIHKAIVAVCKKQGYCGKGDMVIEAMRAFGVCRKIASEYLQFMIDTEQIKEKTRGVITI